MRPIRTRPLMTVSPQSLLDRVVTAAAEIPGLVTLLLHGSSVGGALDEERSYYDVDLIFLCTAENVASVIPAVDAVFAEVAQNTPDDIVQIYRRQSGPMHPLRHPASGRLVDLRAQRIVFWHVSIFPCTMFDAVDTAADHFGGARPSPLLLHTWHKGQLLLGAPLSQPTEPTPDDVLQAGLGLEATRSMLAERTRGYWDWEFSGGVWRMTWRVVPWEDFEPVEFALYAVRWALNHLAYLFSSRLPLNREGVDAAIRQVDPANGARLEVFARAESDRDAWRETYSANPTSFAAQCDVASLGADADHLVAAAERIAGSLARRPHRQWQLPLGAERTCEVTLTTDVRARLGHHLGSLVPDHVVCVTDSKLSALLDTATLTQWARVPPDARVTILPTDTGEEHKSVDGLAALLRRIEHLGLSRQSVCVVVGGGSLGNLGGLVAGLVCRGIPFIDVPSTVTAMLDSAIGQKQAVNGSLSKNFFGMIYPPHGVVIDPGFLLTLPRGELVAGVVEAVKHGLAQDAELLDMCHRFCAAPDATNPLLCEIIAGTVDLKLPYLEMDPVEMADRQFLELGHKVGHAAEHLVNGRLSHGLCVAFGMLAEARLAELIGNADRSARESVQSALYPLRNFLACPEPASDAIARQIGLDNRRRGKLVTFAYLTGPQAPAAMTVDIERVMPSLREAIGWAQEVVQSEFRAQS